MSKSRLKTADWLGVAPSRTASMVLEGGAGGFKYHSLAVHITHYPVATQIAMTKALMATHIQRVRLMAGKETLWSMTGTQLLMLNLLHKVPDYDGILPMVFSAPYLTSPAEEDHLGLGTLDIKRPVIEIDFDDTVINPTIESWGLVYDGPNEPLGRFTMYEDTFFGAQAAAGEFHIREGDQPWVDDGFNLKALHIDVDTISKIVYREDGKPFLEIDTDINPFFDDLMAARTGGRDVVSGWTHIDFAVNRIFDARLTSNWVKPLLSLTTTAATDFSILYEVIVDGLPNRRNKAA